MTRLIELQLKKEAMKKKMEALEAELDLIYFEIDREEEVSEQLEYSIPETTPSLTLTLDHSELHKLLFYLDNSIASHEIADDVHAGICKWRLALSDSIADLFEYDLSEGYLDERTLQYTKY